MVCPVKRLLRSSNEDFVDLQHWNFLIFKICHAKHRFGTVNTVPTGPFDSVWSVARAVGPDTNFWDTIFKCGMLVKD